MLLYRVNVTAILIVLLILKVKCDDSEPKSSMAFVIDITKSMEPVIEKVRENVKKIFDEMTISSKTPIENFVLVLFADPSVKEPLVTNDSKIFENTLQSIVTEPGGDCPEMALSGIQKAVDASLPGSYVYVFTDALAADYEIYDEVELAAQEKECQIVFVLTDDSKLCNGTEHSEKYIVYQKLAEATAGQVFHIKSEDDVSKMLDYVKHFVSSRRETLFSKKILPSDNRTIEVDFDATMDKLTVAITITDFKSNDTVDVLIMTPDNYTVDEPPLLKLGNVLIKEDFLTVKGVELGKYNIQVYANVTTFVIVTVQTDVRFRHGFSTKSVSSLNNTVIGPIRASDNYLFIKLFGDNVKLTSVQLLDPDYKSLLNLPLKAQDDKQKLYVTELFIPPSSKFRISVIGFDAENRTIRRYGNLVLETEKPKPPNITITGDAVVEYNGALQLNCTVEGFPEPRIVWKHLDDGSMLTSKIGPSNNRILDLDNLTKNESIGCYAENSEGKNNKTVEVKVKPEPYVEIQAPENLTLDYNAKGVLHCKVNSYPPAQVTWINKNLAYMVKSKKIMISSDNSTLTIDHMSLKARGAYFCQVQYLDKTYLRTAVVDWTAKKPTIQEPLIEDIFFKGGDDIVLKCSAEGKPQPMIKWFFKWSRYPSSKFQELKEYRNEKSIKIKKADGVNTGVYLCAARNVLDYQSRRITVDFETTKPKVHINTTGNVVVDNSIVVKNNTQVDIKCKVEGTSTPKVEWLKDDAVITPDNVAVKIYNDHTIRLFKASLNDTGTYTCKAENKIGVAEISVNLTIYSLQLKTPNNTKFIKKVNENVSLPCGDYISSIPPPTFNWIFYRYDKTIETLTISTTKSGKIGDITVDKGNLYLHKLSEDQRGEYTCVAGNIGETTNITFLVDVQFRPKVVKSNTKYSAVEGDRSLKIRCDVTGNPKPTIEWSKNEFPLANETNKILIENNLVIIQNVTRDDAANYICLAKSPASFMDDFGTIEVTVYQSPEREPKKSTTVSVKKGSNQEIKCTLSYTSLDLVRWYKDSRLLKYNNTLELKNAQKSDEGTYTCRVSKLDSEEKQNALIIVRIET